MSRSILRYTVTLAAALVTLGVHGREKTDVVVIANGDRIHGEIVELAYGQLALKTDSMGTVRIEWPDVRSVSSRYRFYVERIGGIKYYGTLEAADDEGQMIVRAAGGSTTQLALSSVASIDQVEATFWSRINGSLSVGFNYTKSSEISVSSIRFDSEYRARRTVATLSFDGDRTTSPGEDTTERLDLSYTQQLLRAGPSFWFGGTSVERNEELGIETRVQVAGGMGLNVRQTLATALTTFAGIAVNQEYTTGEDDSQQTVEGVLGIDWRVFRFQDPETTLSSSLVVYPGITESGRYRTTLDISLRREMIEDLFVDLSLYGAYDNRPPAEDDSASSDYGIVTSVGYSF